MTDTFAIDIMSSMRFFVLFLSAFLLYPASIRNVNLKNYKDYARVIITLSAKVNFRVGKIKRNGTILLYVDMYGASPGRAKPRYYFKSNLVELIRVARQDRRRMRAVIYLRQASTYKVYYLPSPPRIIVDIFSKGKKTRRTIIPKETTPQKQKTKFPLTRQLGLKIKRIVIDPGHGGKDPGCINQKLNLKEKDITLDISLMLKELLENDGFEAILTREKDKFIPLEERPAIANSKNADLFISIHVNWSKDHSISGVETFYLNFATDPEAERVAAFENETSSKTISQLKDILQKIVLNEKIRESKTLALYIQNGLVQELKKFYKMKKDMGVRGAPFFVLIGAEMPAILVETSFLSNPEEAKLLSTSIYRARIAHGIYTGIKKFVKFLEEG